MAKLEKEGLKPIHHGELNTALLIWPGGSEARDIRIKEIRQEYTDNNVALQQIDVYEGNNNYSKRFKQYGEALRSQDTKRIAILERWARIYYPDI